MALVISEDWIRERVGLKHNNLEDVRSLSLPGTYHEKIGNLGEALRKFTRIKSLDLSRNAVESIAGIETLKLLEKLNLYYNNVGSLQELYRLRQNQKLQELDLRLNPVARNEPDYRLFLIHMLPNLRRLDDRAVRDSERKAALMHFSTDQARELTLHAQQADQPEHPPNPRAEQVKSMAKPATALTEDDVQVLEYMNPQRGQLTGSAAKQPAVEDYPPETLREINRAGIGMEQADPLAVLPDPVPKLPADMGSLSEFQSKYPNLPVVTSVGAPGDPTPGFGLHQQTEDQRPVQPPADPNLKYTDEIEAYTSYKSKGEFTPNPEGVRVESVPPRQQPESLPRLQEPSTQHTMELYTAEDLEKDLLKLSQHTAEEAALATEQRQSKREPVRAQEQPEQEPAYTEMPGDAAEVITKVSSLVDKYWNGSKSLLKNIRFKNQMCGLLKEYRQMNNDTQSVSSMASTNASLEFEISRLKHQLDKSRKENEQLKEKVFQGDLNLENVSDIDEAKMKTSYLKAQRDVKILRDRLQRSIEENKELHDRIGSQNSSHGYSNSAAPGDVTGADIDKLQRENRELCRQIDSLNIKAKQFQQMQELAVMLQESHKSLVQTNDHLLKEMEETRQRHKTEVQQLSWNYNQLKRSLTQPQHPAQGFNGQ